MPDKAKGEIVLYKTPEGDTLIDVKLEEETVWLTSAKCQNFLIKCDQLFSNTLRMPIWRVYFRKIQLVGNSDKFRKKEKKQ